jgi:hypothetical protein
MNRNGRKDRNVSFSQLPMRTTSNQPTLTINEQEQLHRITRGQDNNPTMETVHGWTSQVQERPDNSYWQTESEKQEAIYQATQAYLIYGEGVYKTPTGQEFQLREEEAGNGLINVIACFATIGCGIILAGIAANSIRMFGAKKSKRKSKKGKSKKGKSKKGKSKKGKSKKGKSKRKY